MVGVPPVHALVHATVYMPEADSIKMIMPKNLHYNSTTQESEGIKNNCSVIRERH
jgi:hypothetical protein